MNTILYPDRQGFVYVLQNRSMRTADGRPILKIGATRKHPVQRAKELGASTGVPEPMQLAYFRDYQDCFLAETYAHEHFAAQRVNELREFFEVDLAEAIAYLDGLPNSSTFREELASQGITGGSATMPVELPNLRFAELFATFPDDGSGRELTEHEQRQCRALAGRA